VKIACLDNNDENSKHQKPNLKQILMTQIQNPKRIIRLLSSPMAISSADKELCGDAIRLRCNVLVIEICDLFENWCLKFVFLKFFNASGSEFSLA